MPKARQLSDSVSSLQSERMPKIKMSTKSVRESAVPLASVNRRSNGDEVDCIDKKCFLVHQLRQICVIPLPTNNTLCDIPCVTDGCTHETHHSIVCPIWLCKPVSTTSTTTSTTTKRTTSTTESTPSTTKTTTTTTPKTTTSRVTTTTILPTTVTSQSTTTTIAPPMPVSCHSLIMYLSIGFNIILFVALLAILVKYFKLKREDREFEAEIHRRLHTSGDVDRFAGRVGDFSIESLENLLAEENERAPLLQSQIIRRQTQQQTHSNTSSVVSDNTFLNHRPPPHMSMKTFKPETTKENQTTDINETKV